MFFKLTRDDISPRITALVKTAQNPTPVFRAMGTTFKSITEGTFNSVGAAYRPIPWKPKRDGSPSILQSRNPVLSKAFQLEATASYARLSNPAIYAGVHQFGATIVPKKAKALRFQLPSGQWVTTKKVEIPARPFYPIIDGKLTPKAEEKIARAGERAIARQVGGEVK